MKLVLHLVRLLHCSGGLTKLLDVSVHWLTPSYRRQKGGNRGEVAGGERGGTGRGISASPGQAVNTTGDLRQSSTVQ